MANIVPDSVLKYTGYLSIPIYKYGAARWNEALNEAMAIIDAWARDRGTEIIKARGAASELDGRLTPMEDQVADIQSFLETNSDFQREAVSDIDLLHTAIEWALQSAQVGHKAIERLQVDLGDHKDATDPHPQYATDQDLADHEAAADPHGQYALESAISYQHGTVSFGAASDPDFRSDFASVSLSPELPSSDYRVHVEPDAGSSWRDLGEVEAYDYATNGFKLRCTGSGGGTVRWSVIDIRI